MFTRMLRRRNYSEKEPDAASEFPSLSSIGAYFHQDWMDEADNDPWKVVEWVLDNEANAGRLPLEIADMLASRDDAGIDEVLNHFGNEYDYTEDGLTGRDFLEMVAERARARPPTPDSAMSPLIGRQITAAQTAWPYWVQAEGLTIRLLTGTGGYAPRTSGVAEKRRHLAPWLEEAIGERIIHATANDEGVIRVSTRHERFSSLQGPGPTFSIS